jgi:multidrug efflux pump subunit AcrB
MWIVRLALARPFSVAVMALLIALAGGLSIATMSKDVFPKIDIPVVALVWGYEGMSADEIEKRLGRT